MKTQPSLHIVTFLCGWLWLTCASGQSSDAPLRFAINAPGAAPYFYLDFDTQEYDGVIPAILRSIESDGALSFKFIETNRIRSEQFLYDGKADLFMSSKQWLNKPEETIVTDTIVEHRSFLYATDKNKVQSKPMNMQGERVCTRRGYTYPSFKEAFTQGKATKVDAVSQLAMLKMLLRKRCDLVIMHEFNAMTLFGREEFRDKTFYRSAEPSSVVPLVLVLRKPLTKQRDILNQYIQTYKASNKINPLIKEHSIFRN